MAQSDGSKCTKHSATVIPHKEPDEELFRFEAKRWDETFQSQGGIYRITLANERECDRQEAATPTRRCTGMQPTPYHCRHGDQVFTPSCAVADLKSILASRRRPTHRKLNICLVSAIDRLPRVSQKNKSLGSLSRWPSDPVHKRPGHTSATPTSSAVYQLPLTCVTVTWGPGSGFTEDSLYHWLCGFGDILFKIPADTRTRMYVTFDSLVDAHRAVNCGNIPAAISVTWAHPKFYNFGQLKPLYNYSLSNDPKWMGIIYDSKKEASEKRKAICRDITIPPEEKVGCPKQK